MKIKDFYQKHKKVIFIGTGILVVAGGVFLFLKNRKVCERVGRAVIEWTPTGETMPLEKVKTILDVNAVNGSKFAIFREGPNPAEYVCLILGDGFVIPPA